MKPNKEFRKIFERVAAEHRARGDHERAAKVEVAREYFMNPKFRAAMEEAVWKINEAKA